MCGRYTREFTWAQVRDFLDLRFPDDLVLRPSYNVAPTQIAPIVRLTPGGREMAMARWGLVPSWAKDLSIGSRLINARAETAPDKPAFRVPFARRRCVVPASGFYEWTTTDAGARLPFYLHRADAGILLLAALWDRWDKGPDPVESFTILTTTPNALVARLHDRMPVILEPESVAPWLDPGADPAAVRAMLAPAPDGVLDARPVSTRVNTPRNDDPSLLDDPPA